MSKRSYDSYFKSKKHKIKDELVKTFITHDKYFLLSNGYSIIMVDTMYTDYMEYNKYKGYLVNMFETFNDRDKTYVIDTLDLDTIKNNLDLCHEEYNYNKDYAIDYTLLKKIIDVIGCEKINIIDTTKSCVSVVYDIVIEVIGKRKQVGYLLPMRKY